MRSTVARAVITAASFALLVFVCATTAWAKPAVVITLAQATVATAADGTSHLVPLDANVAIARGSTIRYTVSAKDVGSDAARGLALCGHIPAGTAFVAGSVRGPGGHAEYSLDGKTFSARPMVAKDTPGGSVLEPADPSRYVMVRWVKDAPLEAAAAVSFSYDVIVQ